MTKNLTKKIIAGIGSLALVFSLVVLNAQAAPVPGWDVSGDWDIAMDYLGTSYTHDMTLTQASDGTLTGMGGYPAVGDHTYEWTLTSGMVSGNEISFTADYTMGDDAVTPLTTLNASGTIAMDGTMSGTWSDNYQDGSRSGTWSSTSGFAVALGVLSAEDFGVVNYDTGLGILKGYTAGFGLTDATLEGATSVEVKLYAAGDVLLQTNTVIISKFNADVTGTQFSSPFDVSGDFDYATDGYWTNTRESEYGQSVAAEKVVATVTLANGKVVMATNTALTGDPSTIFPEEENEAPVLDSITSPVTIPELSEFSFDANATDANGDILNFSLFGNPDGSSIDSQTGLFSWTPSEDQGPGDYAFTVIVSDGELTDSQLVTIHVTEVPDENPDTPMNKDECKKGGWKNFTNPSFKNQGQCVSYTNHH